MNENRIIHKDGRRVFFDIARTGCGNGCEYCYIETATEQQVLFTDREIMDEINCLLHNSDFSNNADKYIISLCPSTEPFKTVESTNLVRMILLELIPYGCCFQIATKELICNDFLNQIDSKLLYKGQLVINISINNFSISEMLEPNAAKPELRIKNIDHISKYDNIKACVLIKPFLNITYEDIDRFIYELNEHKPDYICVGIYFSSNHNTSPQSNRDFFTEQYGHQNVGMIREFDEKIKKGTRIPVFPSSLCIFNQYKIGICTPNAYQTELCLQCGMCDKHIERISI